MKNALLYYRGGGYYGCFWEWNYCYWNKDGKWVDIFSSGANGLTTEEDALAFIKDKEEFEQRDSELLRYDNPERFAQFQKDNNAYPVLAIAKELALCITCTFCGKEQCAEDCRNIDGDKDNIVCPDCLSIHTCSCCETVVENMGKLHYLTEQEEIDFRVNDGDGICEICYEELKEQAGYRDVKELLFMSLLTGETDLFSGTLREKYWLSYL